MTLFLSTLACISFISQDTQHSTWGPESCLYATFLGGITAGVESRRYASIAVDYLVGLVKVSAIVVDADKPGF